MPLAAHILHMLNTPPTGYGKILTIADMEWLRRYQAMRQARELYAITVSDGMNTRTDDRPGRKLCQAITPLVSDIVSANSLYVSGIPAWARTSNVVLVSYISTRLTEWSAELAHNHRGATHGPLCDTCQHLGNCLSVASMAGKTLYDIYRHMNTQGDVTDRYSYQHAGHRMITPSPDGPVWTVNCVTCGPVSSVEIYEYVAAGKLSDAHQRKHAISTP